LVILEMGSHFMSRVTLTKTFLLMFPTELG
jgi:hypothetical protein